MNQWVEHTIKPIYDENSKILILGSFPSQKSREQRFFYGHNQNRFWRVLSGVLETSVPQTIPEKEEFLLSHGIALWDVIASCEITGSSDSSIKNAIPNDLSIIFSIADIKQIFVNGKAAENFFNKYIKDKLGRSTVYLPSTSPANAAWSLERLTVEWTKIKESLF